MSSSVSNAGHRQNTQVRVTELNTTRNTGAQSTLSWVLWENEMRDDTSESRIPIVEERAEIEKQVVATGRVRITSRVEERLEVLRDELITETVEVERVLINREVDVPPEIRQEGDVWIIPVVEERIIVEKRWILKEELHVQRREHIEEVDVPVKLRSTRVSVERVEPPPTASD
jgi:stress response protein YsnF